MEKRFLTKIYKKGSKVYIKNVCTEEIIKSFEKAGFQVDKIKEIEEGNKKYADITHKKE
jgi:hypothetical protein